jgi:hypothetical protein
MRFRSLLLLLPCLLVPAAVPLAAQMQPPAASEPSNDTLTVNVLRDRIAIGEIGQLFIKVRNGEAAMPERIEASGLEMIFSGQQSSINIVGGTSTVETTYFYRFRGDNPGTFTIPEFEIRIGDRIAKTRPIVITVVENDGSDPGLDATKPFFGRLELTRDTFYVNEIVPFTLTAYVRGRNAINDVVSAELKHESFIFKGFREVRTEGADVGNSYYASAVIPSHLFALKPGTHRLGPGEIVVRVLDSESSSGFGLSSFFQRTVTREMVTNTLQVTVKPLPNGAPASFTGGIGSFEMTATPSLTTLGVGDPLTMDFEVTGVGNLRTMGAPVFTVPQNGIWKTYEPNKTLNEEEDSDGFRTGKVRFSQVLIPEVRTESIPEFQLSFFDPSKEQYTTLTAGPFPIIIAEARPSDPPTTELPAVGSAAAPSKRPEPGFDDILHIRTTAPRWLAEAPSGRAGLLFWIVQAVFSIVFCTLTGFGAARWIAARRDRAIEPVTSLPFAKAIKRIPRAGAPRREFFRAVSEALASWRREHEDAPPQVLEILAKVSERCDAVLYSGRGETDAPVSPSEAEELVSLLNRLPRR